MKTSWTCPTRAVRWSLPPGSQVNDRSWVRASARTVEGKPRPRPASTRHQTASGGRKISYPSVEVRKSGETRHCGHHRWRKLTRIPSAPKNSSGTLKTTTTDSGTAPRTSDFIEAASRRNSPGAPDDVTETLNVASSNTISHNVPPLESDVSGERRPLEVYKNACGPDESWKGRSWHWCPRLPTAFGLPSVLCDTSMWARV